MSYENAPATQMLATNCAICGRPLVDAASVEAGVGPDCRAKHGIDSIPDDIRDAANDLIFWAAMAAQKGRVQEVRDTTMGLRDLGLKRIADTIDERFVGAERKATISIVAEGPFLKVTTPYRRGASEEFIAAWRAIPGRRYAAGANLIPVAQGQALYALLKAFFPGDYATGPKGLFRIPKPETARAE